MGASHKVELAPQRDILFADRNFPLKYLSPFENSII